MSRATLSTQADSHSGCSLSTRHYNSPILSCDLSLASAPSRQISREVIWLKTLSTPCDTCVTCLTLVHLEPCFLGRVEQQEELRSRRCAVDESGHCAHHHHMPCLGLARQEITLLSGSVTHLSGPQFFTILCKVQTSGGSGVKGCPEVAVLCERVFEKGGICAFSLYLPRDPTTTYLGSSQSQYNQCFNIRFYPTLKYTLYSLNFLI